MPSEILRYSNEALKTAPIRLERGYKEQAHARWNELLHPGELRRLVRTKQDAKCSARRRH